MTLRAPNRMPSYCGQLREMAYNDIVDKSLVDLVGCEQ